MTTRNTHSRLNLLTDQDVVQRDLLREMVETLYHSLMEEEEDTQHVGAGRHERSSARSGKRNGYKPRNLTTRVGKLQLKALQVREVEPYHPSFFCRWERTERAVSVACCEMYFQGASTRVGA